MRNKKIAFFWFGIDGRYGQWKDGLWAALKILEIDNEIRYYDITPQNISDVSVFNPDVVLLWEAPICSQGKDAWAYNAVRNLPQKKILLFAGGRIEYDWIDGFDHICVESKINCEELCALGFPHSTAFGINDEIFKPIALTKLYDGIHHGTFADWKRQRLVGEALGNRAMIVGRKQETDTHDYNECVRFGANILPEQPYEEIVKLINQSSTLVQTANYWGGGQRATLEAMACGVPVVVMSDSPKNIEFVEDSGFGIICEPNVNDIRQAVEDLKEIPLDPELGIGYVQSKWTAKHYADALLKVINTI